MIDVMIILCILSVSIMKEITIFCSEDMEIMDCERSLCVNNRKRNISKNAT